MTLKDWANTVQALPPIEREEALPYALPVVIRLEKNQVAPTNEAALEASARLLVEIFASEQVSSDAEWRENLRTWVQGRIRKVVRRARGSAWDKLRDANEIYINHNGVEILALPPHPVTEIPQLIRNLQVSGLELLPEENKKLYNPTDKGLTISINSNLTMSTGKAMAQVGHAAQIAIMQSPLENLSIWEEKGFPIHIASDKWQSQRESGLFRSGNIIRIHDAGFTEIEPGSATCEAILNL